MPMVILVGQREYAMPNLTEVDVSISYSLTQFNLGVGYIFSRSTHHWASEKLPESHQPQRFRQHTYI